MDFSDNFQGLRQLTLAKYDLMVDRNGIFITVIMWHWNITDLFNLPDKFSLKIME